jgi:hypothetical protein
MSTMTETRWVDQVMDLLGHGVPLTLLCDLVDPEGPRSDEVLAIETLST